MHPRQRVAAHPLVKHPVGAQAAIELNIPFVSAIMQSVSGPELAIELARNGGLSFIFGSQPIASQADMVRRVKKFKAGFVTSDSNLTPDHTLADVLQLIARTGHSTIGITHDGSPQRAAARHGHQPRLPPVARPDGQEGKKNS